jgi:hypothetical protein
MLDTVDKTKRAHKVRSYMRTYIWIHLKILKVAYGAFVFELPS